MATKPTTGHLDWITDDDGDKFAEPSGAKKLAGWVSNEKPPFQYFNWAFRLIDRWLKWTEASIDEFGVFVTNASGSPNIDDEQFEFDDIESAGWTIVGPTGTKERWTLAMIDITGGTFTLGDGSTNTSPIAFDATAATIQAELETVYGAGNVTVERISFSATVWIHMTFESSPPLVALDSALTGVGFETLYQSSFVWSALDAIPENAAWVEITINMLCYITTGGTAGATADLSLYARNIGGDEFSVANQTSRIIARVTDRIDSDGGGAAGCSVSKKIQVTGRSFEIIVSPQTDFTTINGDLVLCGYGARQ